MSELISGYYFIDSMQQQVDEMFLLQELQMEEDAKIASNLQYLERQRCGHQANSRHFTALEKVCFPFLGIILIFFSKFTISTKTKRKKKAKTMK